ncbi:MAG: ThiF family adenylyltransferase [Bacteroidales bacterium]|nr:ThiF family adenylyltransferase [Bacteroidales bacterium]
MLNTLASHNDDIKRLVDKGYAVSIDSNYLVIRDIPYLDNNRNLQIGAFVSKMIFIDQVHVKLEDHQIFFCGSHPCHIDGSAILNLGGGPTALQLVSPDLFVQRSFSNKPPTGFRDFFEKVESYLTIISGPAINLHNANPYTFRLVEENTQSVFKYRDTLTSRAEIGDLSLKFESDIIAIVGLGGTGSYLLDFIVKTPVKEIRAFDLDFFHVHNAFRSPGKLDGDELGKSKAEVYQKRYNDFRSGLNIHSKFILAGSTDDLEGVTFAFVCVDKGSSRAEIFDLLIKMNIPFIDVGMGLDRDKGPISGTLRTTFFSKENAHDLQLKGLAPMIDLPKDIYQNNIQISELNALNACLAVIKYKQLRGFYADDNGIYHMLFTIDSLHSARE